MLAKIDDWVFNWRPGLSILLVNSIGNGIWLTIGNNSQETLPIIKRENAKDFNMVWDHIDTKNAKFRHHDACCQA